MQLITFSSLIKNTS